MGSDKAGNISFTPARASIFLTYGWMDGVKLRSDFSREGSGMWQTNLPGAKGRICVLDAGDALYAGSHGCIYKVRAADGRLSSYWQLRILVPLKHIGSREVRLAVSADGAKLFIGSSGHVACVSTSDFALQWWRRIGRGGDPVNLLLNGKDLYAGISGRVFQLDRDNGQICLQNDLKWRRRGEVRLALAGDKTQLFVGIHGNALALDTADLKTRWKTRLKRTGARPITILARAKEVYGAGKGRLFKLTSRGTVMKTRILSSVRRNVDVCMQFAGDGRSLLLGTDGCVLSVDAASLGTLWQTKMDRRGSAVSVLDSGDVVYAGNCRHVVRLASANGRMTFKTSLGGRDRQEPGMALPDHGTDLFLACNHAIWKTSGAGDLAAGWQAIIATRRRCVNQTLKSLFDAGVIPNTIEFGLKLFFLDYVASAEITGAPEIIGGDSGHMTLEVALRGEIVSAKENGSKNVAMDGHAGLTVNLGNIQARVEQETVQDFLLSFDLSSGPLFDAIDLSRVLTPPLTKLLEPAFLKAMNQAVPSSLQVPIPKPLPSSLSGLVVRFAYTKVPGDEAKDFLSVLFAPAGDMGSFDLAPAIIGDQAGADTAFILSNRAVMEAIMAAIGNAAGAGDYGFELSNDYPACIRNANEVRLHDVPNVRLRIRPRAIQMNLGENGLHIGARVSYRNRFTAGWRAIDVTSATSFAAAGGHVRLTFTSGVRVPGAFFLNLLLPAFPLLLILRAMISRLFDREGDLLVPGFDVSSISTPAYVQICGKVNRDKKDIASPR